MENIRIEAEKAPSIDLRSSQVMTFAYSASADIYIPEED